MVASGPNAPSALPDAVLPDAVLPDSMLAGTADRERAVDVLRAGLAEGRLSQQEFEERLTQVYASRTYGELNDLTGDLPAPAFLPHLMSAPTEPPAGEGRRSASAAGLALIGAAMFTLAALVTAVAVYLHARGNPGATSVAPPSISPAHLLPAIKMVGPHTHLRAIPTPPSIPKP
jgi:hypothetical protein